MGNTLKIGIIGCGNIANTKHMPTLAKNSMRAQMIAFCDIDEKKALQAKEKYGTKEALACTDYNELLQQDLDAVHICTPNRSHAEITIAALTAGKHVMCEKPMAISSKDAKKMLEAEKRSGKFLTIAYQNRFRADTLELKKMSDAGDLGEIYMAKAHALRRRGIPTWGVFSDKYEQGGGPLIDIATHSLDITLWLMNNYKPRLVIGAAYDRLAKILVGADQGTKDHWNPSTYEVEDAAFGYVVFENGASVFVESSWALNTVDQKQAMTTLYGTKAGAQMEYATTVLGETSTERNLIINKIVAGEQVIEIKHPREPGAAASDLLFNYPGGDEECRVWLDALEGTGNLVVTSEQALVVTQILEAIYESASTQKAVTF